MPLAPADLLEPKGPIAPSFFPGEDTTALTARLQAYLDDGVARAAAAGLGADVSDRAVRAWAEYRVWNAIVLRMSTESASVTIQDQGARTRTNDQLKNIVQARDAALAMWNAAVPAPDEVSDTGIVGGFVGRGTSGSTANVFTW